LFGSTPAAQGDILAQRAAPEEPDERGAERAPQRSYPAGETAIPCAAGPGASYSPARRSAAAAASLQQKAEGRASARGEGHLALMEALDGVFAVLKALGEVLPERVAAPNAAGRPEPARH